MIELWITFAAAGACVVLFATERVRPALVSVGVMSVLLLTGVLSPAEGLSGLSNQATVTVAAMFVLSAGLQRTGALKGVADRLGELLSTHYRIGWLGLVLGAAVASAFVNNTAIVAMLIPIVIDCSRKGGASATRLLLPVSFGSMLGGVCTLLGTSTNLVVSAVASQHGEPALTMFELTPVGLLLLMVGVIYLFLVAPRLPDRRASDDPLTQDFGMHAFLSTLRLDADSKSVGYRVGELPLAKELDLDLLAVVRDGEELPLSDETRVEAGDTLRVRALRTDIEAIHRREGVHLDVMPVGDADLDTADAMLVEAVVTADSKLAGTSLEQIDFAERLGAVCLAVRQRGELHHRRLPSMRLLAGDVLLLAVPRNQRRQLEEADELLVISHTPLRPLHRSRRVSALAVLAGVVLAAISGLAPIAVSAVTGAIAMVLLGCLSLDDAYDSIHWDIVLLLGGMLALGRAFQSTGAGELLASHIAGVGGQLGPYAVLALVYLITVLSTAVMSNNATAALLTPIAISVAGEVGADPRPFLVAVAFAASASFLTPIGYQTNTMIYGAGHYEFADFVRIGGPLTLLCWAIATLTIPWFWPF